MQNINLKKLKLFLTFLFFALSISLQATNAQSVEQRLQSADSLFNVQRYTQAFDLYQTILEKDRTYSPAMLLKMAYIKEGLGVYSEALYYLNLYYLQTSNEQVLSKMEELAKEHNLEGYEYKDTTFFATLLQRYHSTLLFAFLAFVLFLFALMIYHKKKTGKRPLDTGVIAMIILVLLLVYINLGFPYKKGIIKGDQTYLMAGPSAAAPVVDIIGQGHRVKVLGQEDVWVKIDWKDGKAYIKENQLKKIKRL